MRIPPIAIALAIPCLVGSPLSATQEKSTTLKISGMKCEVCAAIVEKQASQIPGVSGAKVNQPAGLAQITYDPSRTSAPAIARLIQEKTAFPTTLQPGRESQESGQAAGAQEAQAFVYYERIRSALAADRLDGIQQHSSELAPIAETIAGTNARKATDALAKAKNLKDARESFGRLSSALIPAFEGARMKDVHIFTCAMVKKSWAQTGTDIKNPYMGKSMLTCGSPASPPR